MDQKVVQMDRPPRTTGQRALARAPVNEVGEHVKCPPGGHLMRLLPIALAFRQFAGRAHGAILY